MSHTVEKIASNKVKMTFTVPAEEFDAALQKTYLKMRGRINVPGFRKGKAPRKLIESMYGEGVFYEDAFDSMFEKIYVDAITESEVRPVDRPSVDVQQMGAGQELQFTAEVFVRPDVTLGEYKGVEVEKHQHPVTDEMIDERIQRDVDKASTTEDVEGRAVEAQDIVNLDYVGTVDGVAFEGGTAQGQTLTIGSGAFIPGFEEQMVGMAIGEEKDITVKFPDEYHAEELAGKEAVFHVKVNGIQQKVAPALDDDFAADVSEFDTLAEYREGIRKELQDVADKNADTTMENNLIQKVVDAADCDIPEAMIEDEIDDMVRDMRMRMQYQGMRYEDYLKYTGQTEEQVREMYKSDAQNRVKMQRVLEAIRKEEAVEPTEEEVDGAIAEQAERMGREAEEFRASLSEGQLSYITNMTAIKKVVDLIKDSAKVTLCAGEHDHAHE